MERLPYEREKDRYHCRVEWRGKNHRDRMNKRENLIGKKNVGWVNGIPVGYIYTFGFIWILIIIIVCLAKGTF